MVKGSITASGYSEPQPNSDDLRSTLTKLFLDGLGNGVVVSILYRMAFQERARGTDHMCSLRKQIWKSSVSNATSRVLKSDANLPATAR